MTQQPQPYIVSSSSYALSLSKGSIVVAQYLSPTGKYSSALCLRFRVTWFTVYCRVQHSRKRDRLSGTQPLRR